MAKETPQIFNSLNRALVCMTSWAWGQPVSDWSKLVSPYSHWPGLAARPQCWPAALARAKRSQAMPSLSQRESGEGNMKVKHRVVAWTYLARFVNHWSKSQSYVNGGFSNVLDIAQCNGALQGKPNAISFTLGWARCTGCALAVHCSCRESQGLMLSVPSWLLPVPPDPLTAGTLAPSTSDHLIIRAGHLFRPQTNFYDHLWSLIRGQFRTKRNWAVDWSPPNFYQQIIRLENNCPKNLVRKSSDPKIILSQNHPKIIFSQNHPKIIWSDSTCSDLKNTNI